MTDQVPSKEWGSPEQVKFVIGFVKETKRQGYEMCPLHVDFLLAVLERQAPEPPVDYVLELLSSVDDHLANARWDAGGTARKRLRKACELLRAAPPPRDHS